MKQMNNMDEEKMERIAAQVQSGNFEGLRASMGNQSQKKGKGKGKGNFRF